MFLLIIDGQLLNRSVSQSLKCKWLDRGKSLEDLLANIRCPTLEQLSDVGQIEQRYVVFLLTIKVVVVVEVV